MLRETSIALSARTGKKFERAEDQLGPLYVSNLALSTGDEVELSWRPDGPAQGVAVATRDVKPTLSMALELVTVLQLKPADVTWLTPALLWAGVEPPTGRRVLSFNHCVRAVSALLYRFDPGGMGSSVHAPIDEYDDIAQIMVIEALRSEDVSSIVLGHYANASDAIVDTVSAVLRLAR